MEDAHCGGEINLCGQGSLAFSSPCDSSAKVLNDIEVASLCAVEQLLEGFLDLAIPICNSVSTDECTEVGLRRNGAVKIEESSPPDVCKTSVSIFNTVGVFYSEEKRGLGGDGTWFVVG